MRRRILHDCRVPVDGKLHGLYGLLELHRVNGLSEAGHHALIPVRHGRQNAHPAQIANDGADSGLCEAQASRDLIVRAPPHREQRRHLVFDVVLRRGRSPVSPSTVPRAHDSAAYRDRLPRHGSMYAWRSSA